jgi:hypothetical protein
MIGYEIMQRKASRDTVKEEKLIKYSCTSNVLILIIASYLEQAAMANGVTFTHKADEDLPSGLFPLL